jgi:CarboxypepD_reg-like domain/TonB-dependent Receptor Plug Domain
MFYTIRFSGGRAIGLSLLFLVTSLFSLAQSQATLSGTIKDAKNGETLIGSTIRVIQLPGVGAVSNEYGFYSLSVPKGDYTFVIGFVGYAPDTLPISLLRDTVLNVNLGSSFSQLREVTVNAKKKNENIISAQTGSEKLDVKELNKLPVLFGERDILKSMQLMPGIKSAGEGNSGFNVRGGSADQNLILLDEATVYNASHLLGFFSVFNSDAIKDATVYKGTQPAQYGSRLSSALDIKMKDGNKKKFEANGSIGLISSKLSIEGPIVKNKGSFFVSGRRTYADLFLKASKDPNINSSKLFFYDLNAKVNYALGKRDVLYLSGYYGRDVLGSGNTFGLDWGNGTATLRWNHIINEKMFSNLSAIFSNYDYKITINTGGNNFNITSRIQDYNIKEEVQFYPSSAHSIRLGYNTVFHNILPGEVSSQGDTSGLKSSTLQKRYSWENALYAADEWKVTPWLNINYGIRLSAFTVLGKGDFYNLDSTHNATSTTHYNSGQVVKSYIQPEPRLSASFILHKNISLKAAYARNTQYLHLLSNSTSTSPSDKWIPSNNNIRPEIADQVSVGYFHNLHQGMYEVGVEGYYKVMQNQVDYKDGADVFYNDAIETQLLYGKGRAYGAEVYIRKKAGRLTGWIAYTLSRSERQISGINNGQWYAAKQDRTHDVSLVVTYDVSKKVSLSGTWVYSTGSAVTFPTGKYIIDGHTVFLYTERNGYRMPDYHRLDIAANFKLKEHKHFSSELSIGLYNTYGRENAYTITFRDKASNPNQTEIVQTALFKFIPSISWNFKIF